MYSSSNCSPRSFNLSIYIELPTCSLFLLTSLIIHLFPTNYSLLHSPNHQLNSLLISSLLISFILLSIKPPFLAMGVPQAVPTYQSI